MITGTTKILGVIGDPISHSLSPVMHNAALTHLGWDYVYLPFAIKSDDLKTAMDGFSVIGVEGFSVTIPHKQTVIPLLSEISPLAQSVGAVNTVYRTEKGWGGTNTDVEGFLAPLKQPKFSLKTAWKDRVCVILGNGGAARAVVVGCAQLGCTEIHVVGRNLQKLEEFQGSWKLSPFPVDVKIHQWENLPEILKETDLLVNTTPIGMSPKIDQSPLEKSLMNRLKEGGIVYDLIYTPNPTRFLQMAEERGAIIIDGLEMLVQQGAIALQLWLKQPVPVEIMRQSLRQYLNL